MADELAALEQAHRRRRLRPARPLAEGRLDLDGQSVLNLSSNDYLGLACDLAVAELAATETAAGATASRLVTGHHPAAAALEEELAAWKGTEAALLFGSGYLANTGVIPALVGRGDTIFADRLNHASLVDGAVLSRATVKRYRHLDLDHLEQLLRAAPARGRRLIVTDAVFSMDGDVADLPALVALKEQYGALLLVDEAHSSGLYGPAGAGLVSAHGLTDQVELQMGTLSKAFGVCGAYLAGRRVMVDYLLNHARSLIYTTGLPPVVLGLLRQALRHVAHDDWRRERLWRNVAHFRAGLAAQGWPLTTDRAAILPVIIGADAAALAASAALLGQGVAAVAIRPPTVPAGTARLRFSLSAAHRLPDLTHALSALATACPSPRDE
jgi:8-amino-7-oxononanoate synthase